MSAPAGRRLGDRRPLQVVEERVIDPLAVERDHRIGDRALAARDQDFLLAVGMQEHQVGAGVHEERAGNLGPVGADVIPAPRGAHVDDVVVQLHRGIGGDVRHLDADGRRDVLVILGPLGDRNRWGQGRSDEEQGKDRA